MNELIPNTYAFVDSSGDLNVSLDKQGTSKLYVAAAVMVDASNLDKVEAGMAEISRNFFSKREVKSGSTGGKHRRRKKILKEMMKLPFGFYAQIVDKRKYSQDTGLQYHRSAFKFLSRTFYQRFAKGVQSLRIVADEHGGRDFMESFDAYLKKRERVSGDQMSLFDKVRWNHEFADSKDSRVVQLADYIAGTLLHCFEPSKRGKHSADFLQILKQREIGIDHWPYQSVDVPMTKTDDRGELDRRVRGIVMNSALEYIDANQKDEDEKVLQRVAILRRLVTLAEYEDDLGRSQLYTIELIGFLVNQGFNSMVDQTFRGNIIGPLRDAGIIITGDNNGYKLSTSLTDVERYIVHDQKIMEPMLGRLNTARKKIKMGTGGMLDILGIPEFHGVRALVDAQNQASLFSVFELDEFEENQEASA